MRWVIHHGDWIERLKEMPDESVHCCVTSPPYWGLRDYGVPGQLGLEHTPDEYVAKVVEGFHEVRRVLRKDGTLWLNLGDTYAGSRSGENKDGVTGRHVVESDLFIKSKREGKRWGGGDVACPGVKPKDLIGIPWLVAFALRSDGWYLRQDIIWAKPNPMPESVTDRCTKSHEYLFLLSKSVRYYFDQDAIREPLKEASVARLIQDVENKKGSDRVPGKTNGNTKAVRFGGSKYGDDESEQSRTKSGKDWTPKQADTGEPLCGVTANKKSVWTVTTQPFFEAHFATFPPKLVEPCILAGCSKGGTVLDPFSGAGTTGLVATRLHRNFIGIELNADYIAMANRRIEQDAPLFNVQNEQVFPFTESQQ